MVSSQHPNSDESSTFFTFPSLHSPWVSVGFVAQPLFQTSSLCKCRMSQTDGVTLLQVKETTAEFLHSPKIIWLAVPSTLLPLLSAFLGEANTGHAILHKTISYTPTGLHFRAGLAVVNAAKGSMVTTAGRCSCGWELKGSEKSHLITTDSQMSA